MARIQDRENVQALRRRGKSIKEISRDLGLSVSSVSYWCRNVILSSAQIRVLQERQRSAGLRAALKNAEKKRTVRIEKEKELLHLGKSEVGVLNKRELFLVGLALYWGEGYKNGNAELGFTNSSPEMILFILRWLRDIFGVKNESFILRVSVNEVHARRIKEIERFWSEKTVIPLLQFTKTSLIHTKSKKAYANAASHYGTLRVKVRRGTDLRRRILGGIEGLKENVIY